ncbi:MAG TPA: zinc ribbon domain-containing protein [Jatrophihabitans sp.]|jgi:hypothetical protein
MTSQTGPDRTTVSCPQCGDTVPAAIFCGACGAHLAAPAHGPGLRLHSYAAGSGEHVLHLAVVSSLFPHLPHRSRAPFRAALLLVAALLVGLALLRWQAALIAASAFGFPLLFQLYLQEADVYDDLPVPRLLLGAGLGAVLGWAWSAGTAGTVRDGLAAGLLGGVSAHEALIDGVLLPLGGFALMLAPALVLRLAAGSRPAESLDGFLLGAIGALGFTVAATLTRLAPQLRTGLVAPHAARQDLLVEALLQGGAVPLTAAALGALVGATLWLRRRDPVHPGRVLTSPILAVVAGAVLFVGLGLVDIWQPDESALLALHALVAATALLMLRIGVHAVLLHEQHDVRIGGPQVCPHCEQVVPTMPFCPHCGSAARAASRHRRSALTVHVGPAEQATS